MSARFLCLFAAMFVAGCLSSPSATRTVSPDGGTAFAISCSASSLDCMLLAGQSCPFGYTTLERSPVHALVECRARLPVDTSCSQPSVKSPGF